MRGATSAVVLSLLAAANAAPFKTSTIKRQDAGKIVAAHFMIGIMENRESAADYDGDIQKAKAAGIDAFALNIAKDVYTDAQLDYAYESAANNDFKVFISFDYNYFLTGENNLVGEKLASYCGRPGQLLVDGKCFVSSFAGDNEEAKLFDAKTIRATAGTDLYLVPNLTPQGNRAVTTVDDIDGAFNWIGWDSNGANRAPTPDATVTTSDFDARYNEFLGGKTYMAPVSPWFFTNFASKAWNFPGDLLWFRRWNEILALSPPMIEIVTWNDFGESHYIGPDAEDTKHTDDGSSAWVNGKPHGGWLELAEPYIAAYKAGATEVTVSEEKLIYWYRQSPKASCGAFDGIDTLQDAVFVVALLQSAGTVTIKSGGNTESFEAPAGASAYQLDIGLGEQTFTLARDGADVFSGTGGLQISEDCGSPINLNAFVGVAKGDGSSVPPAPAPEPEEPIATESATTEPAPTAPVETEPEPTEPTPVEPIVTPTDTPQTPVIPSGIPTPSTNATIPESSAAPVLPTTTSEVELPSSSDELPIATPTSAEIPEVSTSEEASAPTPTVVPPPPAVSIPAGSGYNVGTPTEKCSVTITASEEIRPTNCLAAGQAWAGDGDVPARCDGAPACS